MSGAISIAGSPAANRESRWETVRPLAALLLAAAMFYLAPWPILYLPALLAVVWLTWRRLDLALLLVPLFLPYFMLPKHIVLGSHHEEFAPAEVFLLIAVACAVVRAASRRRLPLDRAVRSPFAIPGLILVLAAGVSVLAAADIHHAARDYMEWVLEPAAYFVLLAVVFDECRQWQVLFAALIASGAIVGVIALAQYATDQDLTAVAGSFSRVKAVYGSADNLGLLFDRVIPIWLAFALFSRRLKPRWRLGVWLLGIPLVIPLVLTYSRGAWLAIGVVGLGLLVLRFHWARYLVLAIVILAAFAALLKGPAVASAIRYGHASTIQRRVDLWNSSLHMLRGHPVLGVGIDNFIHYYAPVHQTYAQCSGLGYMNPRDWREPCLSHPHNVILDFWLSTGIIGLAAFIWLEIVFWKQAVRIWRAVGSYPLIVGVPAAMAAGLIHGMVDESYFLPDLSLMFWMLLGFVSFQASGRGHSEPA
ncbi:MAG: O-antigen ligase family protein [Chloroflexota bacterium]